MKYFFHILSLMVLVAASRPVQAKDVPGYLPIGRRMLFNKWEETSPETGAKVVNDYGEYYGGWTHEGPGTGWAWVDNPLLPGNVHHHVSGWSVIEGRIGSPHRKGKFISPLTYDFYSSGMLDVTNRQACLQNVIGAQIVSPILKEGIGVLYFEAVRVDCQKSIDFAIEIATNRVSNIDSSTKYPLDSDLGVEEWRVIDNLTVNENLLWYKKDLQIHVPIRVKWERQNSDNDWVAKDKTMLAIDNICMSYPHSTLKIADPKAARVPGKSTSAKISCMVSNGDKGQPTDFSGRSVTLYYKGDNGAFQSIPMNYSLGTGDGKGNKEVYDVVISFPNGKETKTLTYYCVADFSAGGYKPIDYTLQKYDFWPLNDGVEPGGKVQSTEKSTDVSDWSKTQASSDLPISRKMLFNKYEEKGAVVDYGDYDSPEWTHLGRGTGWAFVYKPLLKGTNHCHTSGWDFMAVRTGRPGKGDMVPPENYTLGGVQTTNNQACIQNEINAYVASPFYTNGIGYIYFDAVAVGENEPEIKFDVMIATNMFDYAQSYTIPTNVMLDTECKFTDENGQEYDYHYNWQTNKTLVFDGTDNEVKRIQIPLNYYKEIRFKIVRRTRNIDKSSDFSLFAMDNFQVSPPASDVVIEHDPLPFEPAYPGVGDRMKIRCRVSNKDQNVPTTHEKRFVTAYYRWRYLDQHVDEWKSVELEYEQSPEDDGRGNNELWAGTLPEQIREGDLEYSFVCNFDGYRYQPVDYTQSDDYKYWQGADAKEKGTESLSPHRYGAIGTGMGKSEFSRRIRLARSNYSKLFLNAKDEKGQITEPIEMRLMDDNIWWGWVPLNIGRITSEANKKFKFNFMGVGKYDEETRLISSGTNWWSEVGQGTPATPPSGGICQEITDSSIGMWVNADPVARYALIKFDMNTMDYIVCRADYQNFDGWIADEEHFSNSGGGQSKKLDYRVDFDDWALGTNVLISQYFIQRPSDLDNFEPIFSTYAPTWTARSAAYIKTRIKAEGENKGGGWRTHYRNVAIRLMGGDAWNQEENAYLTELGSLTTKAGTSFTDGLKEIKFKANLGQPFNPDRIVRYTGAYAKGNYGVSAMVNFPQVSPSEFSVSLIALYQDADNFLEFRVEQVLNEKDDRQPARLILNRWQNGRVTISTTNNWQNSNQYIGGSNPINLEIGTRDNASLVKGTFAGKTVQNSNLGVATAKGTFGFTSVNSAIRVTSIRFSEDKISWTGIPTTEASNWDVARGNYRLKSDAIESVVPEQRLALYFYPTPYKKNPDKIPDPNGDLTRWTLLNTFTIDSFRSAPKGYQAGKCDSGFYRLQVLSGGADVELDEIEVSSWHGDSDQKDLAENGTWKYNEAWVNEQTKGGNRFVEFDISRSLTGDNPTTPEGQMQNITSCEMENGCGSMEFDYKAVRTPAKLTVQYSMDESTWEDIGSLEIANPMTKWEHASFYAGKIRSSGYLRVVNDRRGGPNNDQVFYTNSWVNIDNVTTWDEPFIDDSAWKVYNAKISAKDSARVILDESRALFLNNSPTDEALPIQDQAEPYLQAPLLLNGLGELSFDARTYNEADGEAAVHIFLTKGDWNAATNGWKHFRSVVVDSNFYKRYVLDVGQGGEEYTAIRLMTSTKGGAKRVCLENVSISEPIYPGFDITDTRPVCQQNDFSYRTEPNQQPLDSDKIGIEARLSNLRMSPSNITVWVDYYVGTNVWGIESWRPGTPPSQRKRMYQSKDNPQIYRTSVDDDLSYIERNEIVQYCVWATCTDSTGTDHYTIIQKPSGFKNLPWYEPVDMNKFFAGKGVDDWSPYFMVYGIPIGTIFINEVNIYEGSDVKYPDEGEPDNRRYYLPYVEIAVPEDFSLEGWQLSFVQDYAGTRDLTNTVYLANVKKSAVTNGYAFYVVGDGDQAYQNIGIWTPSFVDFMDHELSYKQVNFYGHGGILLRRPLGMIEHAICYNSYYDSDSQIQKAKNWANAEGQMPLCFIGADAKQMGSLSVISENGSQTSNWVNRAAWTPGLPNVGQILPDIPQIFPGVSNVIVNAYIDNYSAATQNGLNKKLSFKVPRGTSTNIVYQMTNWCRVVSLTTNRVNALDPAQADSNPYILALDNLQTNTDIYASIGYTPAVPWGALEPVVADWLRSWPDKPLLPSSYNNNPMSITELYWFDLDPTLPHNIEGKILDFEKDPQTNFFVTVYLSIDGKRCEGLQPTPYLGSPYGAYFKIRAKDDLTKQYYDYDDAGQPFGSGWKFIRQFYITPTSFNEDDCTCRLFVPNPYEYILKDEGWDPGSLFLRWEIDFDQMSDTAVEMTNCPVANP